jgi:hypothetical protein
LKGKFNQKEVTNYVPNQAISVSVAPNSVLIYEISQKK